MSSADDRLPQALLDAIAPHGMTRSFPAHAILINEGDSTDSLYIVLSGRVKVYASSDDGREVVLTEYGPGEYFGELAIDGERRSASIKAIESCTCRVVQGSDLRQFLSDHPDFAVHLTRKLIRMVRRLTDQVRSMALQDVYGRMVRVLTEMSEPDGEQRVMRRKLTQQDIADRIGSSREMVNRVMKELTAGGYIGQRDGRMVIMRKLPAAW
jgi:CRP/FNR family cyclic AMP-dependent transcriptional regulator